MIGADTPGVVGRIAAHVRIRTDTSASYAEAKTLNRFQEQVIKNKNDGLTISNNEETA
jgi:hypothetical protein